jgi:hypothetical protein
VSGMRITNGTVVKAKREISGESVAEETTVIIVAQEDRKSFTLGPEAEAELLEAIEEADRGEFISGDALLRELRRVRFFGSAGVG